MQYFLSTQRMTLDLAPKETPKKAISFRITPRNAHLLKIAAEKTRRTQSSIVDECIGKVLGKEKGNGK
jgi:hypothetical protein